MNLLLDTHIFLWYVTGDQRIAPWFRAAIETCEVAYLSVISLWEATIKYQLGKLPLPDPPNPWLFDQIEQHGIEPLPLTPSSVARLAELESHHRDPFDRMLICQALEHDLLIVTVDPVLSSIRQSCSSNEEPSRQGTILLLSKTGRLDSTHEPPHRGDGFDWNQGDHSTSR